MFCDTDLYLHRSIKISCTVANFNFRIKLVYLTRIFCLVLNQKQIPKEVADVFNAPSDNEDFPGFQDDASRQRLLSKDSNAIFDSPESGKKVGMDCRGPVMLFQYISALSLCQGCVRAITRSEPHNLQSSY